jgi:hypothetical protein
LSGATTTKPQFEAQRKAIETVEPETRIKALEKERIK